MVEIGKYYKMVKRTYGHSYYIKDIQYDIDGSIMKLYSIYYETSEYFDSIITNSEFWNDKNNFMEITMDQFIMNYKGTNPLPVKSDIFHTLLF